MIIIHMHFDGGSAEEEHDIAHIASSIVARLMAGFFLPDAASVGKKQDREPGLTLCDNPPCSRQISFRL